MNEFVTSDTHFSHQNIIEYCKRPFATVQEMNEALIESWNKTVGPGDTVYHAGDFQFIQKDPKSELSYSQQLRQQIKETIDRLNGRIILIKGNHDDGSRTAMIGCGFEEFHKKPLLLKEFVITHAPLENVPSDLINLHGHTHNTYIPEYDHPWYVNVATDVHGFRPISLEDIRDGSYVRLTVETGIPRKRPGGRH